MSTETCNNHTGVSTTASSHTDDDESADRLWASFALGLAAGGRVRVARDGRNYRRGWERRVDPAHRPVEPAAVRVYDAAGDTTTVAFDLDIPAMLTAAGFDHVETIRVAERGTRVASVVVMRFLRGNADRPRDVVVVPRP